MPHLHVVRPISEDTELKRSWSHYARIAAQICRDEDRLNQERDEEDRLKRERTENGDSDKRPWSKTGIKRKRPKKWKARGKCRYNLSRLINVQEEVRRMEMGREVDDLGAGGKFWMEVIGGSDTLRAICI